MKVVILGDTHFGSGYSMGRMHQYRRINTRLLDFSNTFDFVVDYMVSNSVFHFVITGDIFEHRRPQASELSIFSEKICRLEELGIHTHIVIGNHDLIREQKATTIDVLKNLKLPKTSIYSDISSVSCNDGSDNIINLIFFPFRTRYMLDCTTNKEAVDRFSERLQYESKGISNNGPKILIGHLMLQETRLGNTVLESNAGEVVLPHSIFKELDAVVMGHIHSHQIIQKDPFITYIGSMERKDFGESNVGKYFLLVDYSDGKLIFNFKKLPVRDLYNITVDQSSAKNGEEVRKGVEEYLIQYNKIHNMYGSIVRLTIFIDEQALFNLNRDAIKAFMKEKLKIQHCVSGIHIQIVSEKQLRKASITEYNDPLISFYEFLKLEKDDEIKKCMKEIGTQIIKERSI
jgi:exonuclease SbcD